MSLLDRPVAPGPKRNLANDGGIRGAITLGVLAQTEALLRERRGRPDLVLADHFGLTGGGGGAPGAGRCRAARQLGPHRPWHGGHHDRRRHRTRDPVRRGGGPLAGGL